MKHVSLTAIAVLAVGVAVGIAFAENGPAGSPEAAPRPPVGPAPGMGMPPPGMGMPEHPPQTHEEAQPLPPRTVKGHFELVPALRPGLSAKDSAVRARAAFCLGQIGLRKTAAQVTPLLDDPSLAVRYQAGIALCQLGDAQGRPAAVAALASSAEWIRYYAVQSLAALASPQAKAALEASRPDQGEFIAEQIGEALEAWPWPSVQPSRSDDPIGDIETPGDGFGATADALIIESDVYWHQGEYLQCVRCNQAAVFLDPKWVEGYSVSAWLLWSLGLNDRAMSILGRGVELNSDSPDAWFNMGYHYVLMKEHLVGARFLRKAVELGASPIQHRQYCHALENAGYPDEALDEWQRLLEAHPDDPIAPRQIRRLKNRGEKV